MNIHFIGIGGIGVSALARYYLQKGHKITGSDLVSSEITSSLEKSGVKIKIGIHKKRNVPGNTDLVIYSEAVPEDNAELREAKKLKIKRMSGAKALGELTKKYFTIAVAGTHGKSTTTAMLGLVLAKAGFDPTVIVGTKLKEFNGSNCRVGKSKYLVLEADEYGAKFLNYRPKMIVLTNIDKDHLDYYKTFANVKRAFKKFIGNLPKDGVFITEKSVKQKDIKKLKGLLKVPGEHNAYNAALALIAARALKIPDKVSLGALAQYKGSWRRFEERNIKLDAKSYTLISDYAHHPTEIKVTLKAARGKYPKKKIWCVFQPHQYQRTYYLFDDFVKVFRKAPIDKLMITDIYDVVGREENEIKAKVSSAKLVQKIGQSRALYLPQAKIMDYLKKNLRGGEVVIVMGAGDIYKIAAALTKD
ncbi:MAG: hypothetical protein G01um101430_172 [Parcubacteria group bacterium Gr01-1014_30]|nr:MAG: hypothetical protein G01um101430_172 [Parcubacteria group bacterium Gr01-1014_30]